MDIENTSDPRDNREVSEVVEKPFCLNRVHWGNLPVGTGGANMRENVLHAMVAEETGKLLNPLIVSE